MMMEWNVQVSGLSTSHSRDQEIVGCTVSGEGVKARCPCGEARDLGSAYFGGAH